MHVSSHFGYLYALKYLNFITPKNRMKTIHKLTPKQRSQHYSHRNHLLICLYSKIQKPVLDKNSQNYHPEMYILYTNCMLLLNRGECLFVAKTYFKMTYHTILIISPELFKPWRIYILVKLYLGRLIFRGHFVLVPSCQDL